jgi:hypothetical protein
MNKEFCTYEQSLALRELGFDEICLGMYTIGGLQLFSQRGFAISKGGYTNTDLKTDGVIGAPTYSQAFRWFREEHDLYHVITIADLGKYENGNPNFQCTIYSKDPVLITNRDKYNTYEEAEQACLDKLIEIVKNK